MNADNDARLYGVAAWTAAAAAVACAVAWLLCAATVWTTTRTVPEPSQAITGMARLPWHLGDPANAFTGRTRQALPDPAHFWAIITLTMSALAAALGAVWIRVDALRGRRRLALRPYDPRRRIKPRAFARPRDLLHLRTGAPDSWTMLRLDRRLIGTAPQTHVLTIAPTRSGKTTGPVTRWALEHTGPAIITSTKADIVQLTAQARREYGPVWIYAPAVPDHALPLPPCGWSPLAGCEVWENAQMTGRWLASSGIGGNDVQESDGARFYNHEAGRLLAPLLHAAALREHNMLTVNEWVRSESHDPAIILNEAGADAAARLLDGFRQMESRARTLTIASAGQLIDAYEYEQIARTDRAGFDPEALLDGGTLYLVAPEGRQRLVGPLFAALLGSVFRTAEMRALEHGPLNPQLRVILDEARRLAAIDDLPTLLSVSAGWGVRIATVWQNLDQITARYGREAEEILGNSLAKLILGPIQDRGTRDYLIELLDAEQVDDPTYSVSGFGARSVRSAQSRDRKKASAQSLQQLARGQAIVVHGDDLPARGVVPRPRPRLG